jgi:hypothetical protein
VLCALGALLLCGAWGACGLSWRLWRAAGLWAVGSSFGLARGGWVFAGWLPRCLELKASKPQLPFSAPLGTKVKGGEHRGGPRAGAEKENPQIARVGRSGLFN